MVNGLLCRLVIYTVSFGLFCMGKFGTLCVALSIPYEFLKWNWQGSTCFKGLWFSIFLIEWLESVNFRLSNSAS